MFFSLVASSRIRREGLRPTTHRETWGICWPTSGNTSFTKYKIASSLGSQSMEPVNSSESGDLIFRKGSVAAGWRSEEHTSELQSLRHLVCRLLLEKKKKN